MNALALAKAPEYDTLNDLVKAYVDTYKPDRTEAINAIQDFLYSNADVYDKFAKELITAAITSSVNEQFRHINNELTMSEAKYYAMTQKQTKPPANAPTIQTLKEIVKGNNLLEYNMTCKKILGDCTKVEISAETDMYYKNYIGNKRKYTWFASIKNAMDAAAETATVKEVLTEAKLRSMFNEAEAAVE